MPHKYTSKSLVYQLEINMNKLAVNKLIADMNV